MNVYSYWQLELEDRGWIRRAEGESVFHEHPTIKKLLEILPTGDINVLDLNYNEIGLIKNGDFKAIDALIKHF
jgi:hypothetical protein